MAHYLEGKGEPFKIASAVGQYVPVSFVAGGSAVDETVIKAGSFNEIS